MQESQIGRSVEEVLRGRPCRAGIQLALQIFQIRHRAGCGGMHLGVGSNRDLKIRYPTQTGPSGRGAAVAGDKGIRITGIS
jgi:hypothetical protein